MLEALSRMTGCGMVIWQVALRRIRAWRMTGLSAVFLVIAAVSIAPSCQPTDPILRALQYLEARQVAEYTVIEHPVCGRMVDFAGNWPQEVYVDFLPGWRYREVNPFMPAFIHHALVPIREENLDALGLPQESADTARRMRQRAMSFMRTFESPPGEPDAGAFGFWPYDPNPEREPTALQDFALALFRGPQLHGPRGPVNNPLYPPQMGIPSDADDTANINAAILDDALYDGGPGTSIAFHWFFADWRDLGQSTRRIDPPWLPLNSGAFLTWLHYADEPDYAVYNDIDAVVNANVLYVLGRYGMLDTPGVAESVSLINMIVEEGLHHTHFPEVADYYPDNLAFHYCVSRAYFEGGVSGLAPAVERLAGELEAEACTELPGTVYWDRGDRDLNTAFAILTLMNAGRLTPLIGQGAAYLSNSQNPITGGWAESTFFLGRTEGGPVVHFVSPSLTTAIALEALCRHRLLSVLH